MEDAKPVGAARTTRLAGDPPDRHTQQGAAACDDLNETGDPNDPGFERSVLAAAMGRRRRRTYSTYGD